MKKTSFCTGKNITLYMIISVIFIVFMVVNWSVLLHGSTLLRPGADDYCFGALVAKNGVLTGVVVWWDSWSAYLYSLFLGNLLVGAPLAHLPFSLASGIPFLLALLGVGMVVLAFLPLTLARFGVKLTYILLAGLGWWTFLWTRGALGKYGIISDLAEGVTHWQTLNGTYILEIVFLALAYAVFLRKNQPLRPAIILRVFILGVLAGLAGSFVSLALFFFGFIGMTRCIFGKYSHDKKQNKIYLIFYFVFCCVVVVTVISSHELSPGQHIRMASLKSDTSISISRIIELCKFTIPFSVKFIFKTYISYGNLVVFVFVVSMCICLKSLNVREKSKNTQTILRSFTFFIVAVIFTFSARLSEAFSYEAYWHFLLAALFIYFSIFFAAVYVGSSMAMKEIRANKVFPVLFLFSMVTVTLVNLSAYRNIAERNVRWESGPAPTRAVSDIEDTTGWQRGCWAQLSQNRDVSLTRCIQDGGL